MKKTPLIAVGLGLIISIVVFVYFVSGITSGNSIIKKYTYYGDVREFISNVKKFSLKNKIISTKITDTTVTRKTGFTVYIKIELKDNSQDIVYSIACQPDNESQVYRTNIELVMAYDKNNNVGGYYKQAKGIEPLIYIFDLKFITPLRNSQNIKIIPL